jgi:asparagine synthase (glutamine-hydrolysing)
MLTRGKRLLKKAFERDLPASVFTRKKMGFAVPIGEWLCSSLEPMLRDLLFAKDSFAAANFDRDALTKLVKDHATRKADHSQRLYALLMLELWWRSVSR